MPTIALVDDDHNILTSVSIALEAEGYRTTTYADGASALDGFKSSPPNLAILDIKMPRMDGMETLRRLRQGEREIVAPAPGSRWREGPGRMCSLMAASCRSLTR